MLALEAEKLKNIPVFIQYQADLTMKNKKGESATHIANRKGDVTRILFNLWTFIIYNSLLSLASKVEMLYCYVKKFPKFNSLITTHSIEFLFQNALDYVDDNSLFFCITHLASTNSTKFIFFLKSCINIFF